MYLIYSRLRVSRYLHPPHTFIHTHISHTPVLKMSLISRFNVAVMMTS